MANFTLSVKHLLLCAFFLITTTWSSPLQDRAVPISAKPKKRQQAPFAVTGVQTGGIQPRLEIRDLAANTDAYNIFLLGLQRMQTTDQSNFLSYFQISGIHGRPMADWNGVQGNQSSPTPGYCTHVSNLFLPWHRPYLALYEEILVSNALDAANSFPAGPTRDKYVAAANTLRMPYWDWAKTPKYGNVIPSQITDQMVTVTTPNGTARISNPLATYRYHPADTGLYYAIYVQWQNTLRWPTNLSSNAASQTDQLIAAVNSNQGSFQSRLFNLFTQFNNFMDFSNEPFIKASGPLQYDSIESLHDSIHNTVGGVNYGHMQVIDVSAFDPVFWLHHAMVDRIFAMWQAIYPNTYMEPQAQYQASYWYNAGQVMDQNSPLVPFHSTSAGDFWTAASVRNLTTFGYTYPELVSGNPDDVRMAVNNLYGASTPSKKRSLPTDMDFADFTNSAGITKSREYLANIRAPKNGLGGSYSVHIFLGEPSEDPATWPHDPNLVGTYGVVSSLDAASMNPVIVAGTVPLTRRMEELSINGLFDSMVESMTEEYLKNQLEWRIRRFDGTVVDPSDLPGFAVSVVSMEVTPAASASEFPTWAAPVVHTAVTVDKAGGINTTGEV